MSKKLKKNKLPLKNIPENEKKFIFKEIKKFSETLKKRREELEISQEELAEIVGISYGTIKGIEQGIRTPSLPNFIRISKALELTLTLDNA